MSSPRRSLPCSSWLVAATAALALAAPAAQARPAPDPVVLPGSHHVLVPHGIGQNGPVDRASPDAGISVAVAAPSKRSGTPQVRSTDTGFDATSAAVGAAGVGLIGLLALGAAALTGRRRMRPTA